MGDEVERSRSWLAQGVDRARGWADRARGAGDADTALQATMAALIELAGARYPLDPGAEVRPGQPLKLLFAGYSGTRNTGADVRVEEMIRQVRHLLGDDGCELFITTIAPTMNVDRALANFDLNIDPSHAITPCIWWTVSKTNRG